MSKFLARAKAFLKDEDGPTVVEYAVLMALIVIALIAVIGNLTTKVSGTFDAAAAAMP